MAPGTSSQKRSVAGGFALQKAKEFVLAWESYGQDPGGANGVYLQPFDEFSLLANLGDGSITIDHFGSEIREHPERLEGLDGKRGIDLAVKRRS